MTTHPVIDVRDQQALGPARIFALCLKGIRHRLLRSFLTFAVIVLAVAFFMFLLSGSIDARAVDRGVAAETVVVRRAPQALELWFGRPSPVVMGHRLAIAGAPEQRRLASVTGLEPARIAAAAAATHREEAILGFLDELDAGTRAALVKKAKGREVLAWLADPARWTAFTATLGQLRSLRAPLPVAEMRAAVEAREVTAAEVAAIATAWNAAAERLGTELAVIAGTSQPERIQEWFSAADADALAKWTSALAAHGLAVDFPPEAVRAVQSDVRALRLRDRVSADLSTDEARSAWKKAFLTSPTLDEKLLLLDDQRVAAVLGGAYTREDLAEISRAVAHERRLVELQRALAGKVPQDGSLIGGRQLFLVLISFVVCMVGIANAMLMAITERFREIATMKCLGATDGFILTQFLMEAGMQGVAGGAIGMVIGLLLAMVMDGIAFGGHLFAYLPLLGLLACAGLCIVAGLLLATLASIYPSWMASRMAPMDAMRVE